MVPTVKAGHRQEVSRINAERAAGSLILAKEFGVSIRSWWRVPHMDRHVWVHSTFTKSASCWTVQFENTDRSDQGSIRPPWMVLLFAVVMNLQSFQNTKLEKISKRRLRTEKTREWGCRAEWLKRIWKTQTLGEGEAPQIDGPLESLIQEIWSGDQECAFLVGSKVNRCCWPRNALRITD